MMNSIAGTEVQQDSTTHSDQADRSSQSPSSRFPHCCPREHLSPSAELYPDDTLYRKSIRDFKKTRYSPGPANNCFLTAPLSGMAPGGGPSFPIPGEELHPYFFWPFNRWSSHCCLSGISPETRLPWETQKGGKHTSLSTPIRGWFFWVSYGADVST